MKTRVLAKGMAFALTALFFARFVPVGTAKSEEGQDAYAALESYGSRLTYYEYLAEHSHVPAALDDLVIEGSDFTKAEGMEVGIYENYEGMPGKSILTEERGFVTWEISVRQEGLYALSLVYYPIEGRSSDIRRSVLIDGELPFAEAGVLEFSRIWSNEGAIDKTDTQGNHLKPCQIETPEWCVSSFRDHQGYYDNPFLFYFSAGTHRITLASEREPMLIRSIRLHKLEEPVPYADKLEEYKAKGYKEQGAALVIRQAETAQRKSSPMLYPVNDHSSPAVEPYSAKLILNNTIGGNNWKHSGQWIDFMVEVPESGLYQIALHVKQNFVRGARVYRKLTIDGSLPFAEAAELGFTFQKDWRIETLGDGEDPYLFFLEAGEHTIRLEVVLGELRDYVRRVEEKVRKLNEIYRQVIMIISTEPDVYRDYQLSRKMPALSEELKRHGEDLQEIYNNLNAIAGGKGQRDMVLQTISRQLGSLSEDVEKITSRIGIFKTNIGALGTWLIQAKEQALQLDSLMLFTSGTQLPEPPGSIWHKLLHELASVLYSFVIDYNLIGNVSDGRDQTSLVVWNGQGRDQANTLKYLIDESFTSQTGIHVNLMLVDMGTLLPATLSGQGPDVAMQVGGDLPMNYGMRGAVHDLSGFSDLEDVTKRFAPEIMVPFTFERRVYALPETMSFNMLFYRKDILEELDIPIPKTWEDISEVISLLSVHNLAFAMAPTVDGTYSSRAGALRFMPTTM